MLNNAYFDGIKKRKEIIIRIIIFRNYYQNIQSIGSFEGRGVIERGCTKGPPRH